jgi:hypothetical protein
MERGQCIGQMSYDRSITLLVDGQNFKEKANWAKTSRCEKTPLFLLSAPPRKAYHFPMTKLLDRAVEAARNLPPDAQDEIARLVLQIAGDEEPPIALTAGERAAIALSREAAARGEFATDEQVRAVWAKHGL